jgi:hypothetical protein
MNSLALANNNETPREIEFRATVKELCDAGENVLIMTRADLSYATDLVKAIKTRTKEIEDERTRIVKPFNDGVKAINARFKSLTVPLEDAEADVKKKMLSFQRDEQRRVDEENARLEKARKEAEERAQKQAEEEAADSPQDRPLVMPAAAPVVEVQQPRTTTYGQTGAVSTIKKQWAFELVDIQALAAARPDLVQVDTVKINQEIRGCGGEIPGLRVYEKEIIQVK